LQLVLSDVVTTNDGMAEIPRFKAGLSWPMAKAIHQIMGATIEEYEKREGPIEVPRTVQAIIDKRIAAQREKSGE
jgi:hypothetical protein